VCERGSVGVRCHDSPHDEAARSCLKTFHTASPRTPVNKGIREGRGPTWDPDSATFTLLLGRLQLLALAKLDYG
jgi:hypothetical protein